MRILSGTEIIAYIIQLLVGSLKGIGEGLGGALSQMVQSLVIDSSGEAATFSIFASFVVIFAGISLGFSLFRWVLNFFTSFGNRNS